MTVLLFDLDGTLTDPQAGLVGCVRHAFQGLNRSCPRDEVLLTFIGPSLRGMFATLLDTSDKEWIETAVALYRERYAEIGVFETCAYDGIAAMLTNSIDLASKAFVATSKPTVFAKQVVKHLSLDHHFDGVYGVDLDGHLDDKADLLSHLLVTERVDPSTAIMVGDRSADILAARANGIRSIGVLWGYGSVDELTEAGADCLCESPVDLRQCIIGSLSE